MADRVVESLGRSSRLALGAVLALWATSARAEPVESVSARPDRVGVVIYRDRPVDTAELIAQSRQPYNDLNRQGLALIVEQRTVDLPQGEGIIRFRGVATGIVSQSATLEGLPGSVVERNADFDILSPGSLLAKSVGEVVTVVRTNPVTGAPTERRAIVRSGPYGTVLEVDGQFEALGCSGLTERIVFDRMPEGLSDQPVLSVRTRSPQAGRYTVTLAYLATGLQWSADYVARLNPDGRTLALEGWITLANFGGTAFPDAPVQVVAGVLNRDDDTQPVQPAEVSRDPVCWPQDTTTFVRSINPARMEDRVEYSGPPMAVAQVGEIVVTGSRITRAAMAQHGELGDYKIYTLPERTTVGARQTKQVRFLDQPRVQYDRVYRHRIDTYDEDDGEAPARLLLRARNDRRSGLGLALPGGGVSVIETLARRPTFAGQATFQDRGVGLPVELEMGEAMGVTVRSTMVEDGRLESVWLRTFTVEIANAKTEAVDVEIVPPDWDERGFRIVEQSRTSNVGNAGYPAWTTRVAPGRTETLRFAIETRP